MVKVTLRRVWRPARGRGGRPGDVVEVDTATAAWLEECGALAVDEPQPMKVEEPTPQPVKVQPVEPVKVRPARPAKVASTDTWRAYAETLGVDHHKLNKQQIIAATMGVDNAG